MEKPKSIVEFFDEIEDPRRQAGQRHKQTFVLVLTLMSTMSGCYGYRPIGDFLNCNRAALLQQFKPNKDRLPSFDTVRRVLQAIDFSQLSRQFYQWALQYVAIEEGEWVGVDGKRIGGTTTGVSTTEQDFISLVSLYCSKQKLVIANAQVRNAKESEIPAVRQLIEALDLQGVTFTLDALHCQKNNRRHY